VVATLLAAEGDGALTLQCKDKATDAFFSDDGYFLPGMVKINLRLNSAKATETRWSVISSGRAVVVPNGIKFMQTLPDNGSLIIRATTDTKILRSHGKSGRPGGGMT